MTQDVEHIRSSDKFKDVLIIDQPMHEDERGSFIELWNRRRLCDILDVELCQINLVTSKQDVLRGMHYQYPKEQGKLVTCISGVIFDVFVDIRDTSPTFMQWDFEVLTGPGSRRQVYIPPGYAHGYKVLSEEATVLYACTETYRPEEECGFRYSDPFINIAWPGSNHIVSEKDAGLSYTSEHNWKCYYQRMRVGKQY